MSSKLEPTIWSSDAGHIVIHGVVDGRTVTKTIFSHAFSAISTLIIDVIGQLSVTPWLRIQ